MMSPHWIQDVLDSESLTIRLLRLWKAEYNSEVNIRQTKTRHNYIMICWDICITGIINSANARLFSTTLGLFVYLRAWANAIWHYICRVFSYWPMPCSAFYHLMKPCAGIDRNREPSSLIGRDLAHSLVIKWAALIIPVFCIQGSVWWFYMKCSSTKWELMLYSWPYVMVNDCTADSHNSGWGQIMAALYCIGSIWQRFFSNGTFFYLSCWWLMWRRWFCLGKCIYFCRIICRLLPKHTHSSVDNKCYIQCTFTISNINFTNEYIYIARAST